MPKVIFEAVSGNVIGVVEEPDVLPAGRSRAEACQVKIGAIKRLPEFSKRDAQIVIQKLRVFVENLLEKERGTKC
jgi:hypothetical protein